MRSLNLETLRYNDAGLVAVIAQDAESKAVLMLGWATKQTLQETIELGKMVYFSRSRNQRWLKGETSGNFQEVVSLSQDCDGDAVLALVHTHGPACHNGTSTCFEEA
jgi:phosphoribosyl-AMP cyclohydrolase